MSLTTDQVLELIPPDEDAVHNPAFDTSTSRKRRRPEADDEVPNFASETILHSPPRSPRQPQRREPLTVRAPVFGSGRNLSNQRIPPNSKQRKTSGSGQGNRSNSPGFPIRLDEKGRPKGTVLSGSRRKQKL